eukprot:2624144-Rhodomonas_salina.3
MQETTFSVQTVLKSQSRYFPVLILLVPTYPKSVVRSRRASTNIRLGSVVHSVPQYTLGQGDILRCWYHSGSAGTIRSRADLEYHSTIRDYGTTVLSCVSTVPQHKQVLLY